MKSYLDLREGDFITPTVVIEPLKKCLTVGNLYQIVKFGFNHKGVRKQFYIQDDNGNMKHYNLNTFHRRWQAVEPTQTEAKPTREAWEKNINTNGLSSNDDISQVLHKAHVLSCKAFLLEQLRSVTAALETMDLRDVNRRTQLDRKHAINHVLQMISEQEAL